MSRNRPQYRATSRRERAEGAPETILTPILTQWEGEACPWCGRPMDGDRFPTRDHLVPRARSIYQKRGPLVIVCARCNSGKSHMTIFEWHARLEKGLDRRAAVVARWIAANTMLIAYAETFDVVTPTAAKKSGGATLGDVWPVAEPT